MDLDDDEGSGEQVLRGVSNAVKQALPVTWTMGTPPPLPHQWHAWRGVCVILQSDRGRGDHVPSSSATATGESVLALRSHSHGVPVAIWHCGTTGDAVQ